MALINKLIAIGDAIRAKTGSTKSLTLDQMVTEINKISSGAELNFYIVGGTVEPSNPKENTLWVNTDSPITSWNFSVHEPDYLTEGMVWFYINTSSGFKFNALKENVIQVYPQYAKQYVNGSFSEKDVRIYVDGEWKDFWDGHYFKNGNQYVDITGGWTTSGDVTIGTTMDFYSPAGYESEYATASTVNMIDLTNVNTLYCEHTHDGGQYKQHLCVGKEVKSYTNTDIKVDMGGGIAALNVSDLNGEYYIYIDGRGGNQGSLSVSVSAIWGE